MQQNSELAIMEEEPLKAEHAIEEARALLNAAWHTVNEERHYLLIAWARQVLQPFVDAKHPEAIWVWSSFPEDMTERLTEEEFDRRHRLQVETAAAAGHAGAKFWLACELDEEPTRKESAALFQEAAELGYSYAKWCHGLNLLSGSGIDKDKELGIRFIFEAAHEKFEGAIQFLAQAYANGSHGLPKDEQESATWWAKLKDDDLIHY
jgi:hypothetical protein